MGKQKDPGVEQFEYFLETGRIKNPLYIHSIVYQPNIVKISHKGLTSLEAHFYLLDEKDSPISGKEVRKYWLESVGYGDPPKELKRYEALLRALLKNFDFTDLFCSGEPKYKEGEIIELPIPRLQLKIHENIEISPNTHKSFMEKGRKLEKYLIDLKVSPEERLIKAVEQLMRNKLTPKIQVERAEKGYLSKIKISPTYFWIEKSIPITPTFPKILEFLKEHWPTDLDFKNWKSYPERFAK